MTDEVQAVEETAPKVVQTEAEQAPAPEAAESTEGQVETQPAEEESSEEKKSASAARRERRKAQMDRLKDEKHQAEAKAGRLEAELQRLNSVDRPQPPRLEDFADHDEYVAALSAHKATEMLDQRRVSELEQEAERQQRHQETIAQRQIEEAHKNWVAQAEEARHRYADFDAVTGAPDVPITQNMATLIGMSDVGADIAYHLGMNPDEARTLAQMPVPELVGAMKVMERLVAVQTPRPRTQTQAPEPVKPVKPKATATKKVEDMSMAEYMAARKAGKI